MNKKHTSETQAVIFFKPKWSVSKAKIWLREHNIIPLKLPDTKLFKDQIRFRITNPKQYKTYTSKKLEKDGKQLDIQLILGWK